MNRFVTKKFVNGGVTKDIRCGVGWVEGEGSGLPGAGRWRDNVMRVYRLRSTFDLPDQVNLKLKVIFDISDTLFISVISQKVI